MSTEPHGEEDRPQPLDYQTPVNTTGYHFPPALLLMGGFTLAVAALALGSMFLYFSVHPNWLNGPVPPSWPSVAGFGVIIIASLVLLVREGRVDPPRRRWFAIGLLLGAAITSLLEGLCFAAG